MKFIEINGEQIDIDEAQKILRIMYNDARKVAGEFHTMNRSAKFRVNWPDEYKFADANWKTFVEAARKMYAERLGDPKTPPNEARTMFLALAIEAKISQGKETDTRLQLAPNTQQFEGDPYENRKIADTFGTRPNLRAALMNATATRH